MANTQNYRSNMEQQHGNMGKWSGEIHELNALLRAAQRYTDDGNEMPAYKVEELDALIDMVARSLMKLEQDMDEQINGIVEVLNEGAAV